MAKTVLITGCSSGIGHASALAFANADWNVIATMRKPNSSLQHNNITTRKLDVTQPDDCTAAISAAISAHGSLDALVNNAGYALAGPMEAVTDDQISRQFETNVFGPVRLMRAALPHMRAAKSGVIINVSSVGGRITLPFNAPYHGTKFALEGITEAMWHEVENFGIRVKIVEPGGVSTNFFNAVEMARPENTSDYNTHIEQVLSSFTSRRSSQTPGGYSTPDDVAQVILEAANDASPQLRYIAGDDAKALLDARANMSDADFHNMIRQNFAP